MQNIDWNIYRHPEFLKALKITNSERKYLNLFLKRRNFEIIENLDQARKNRVISLAEV
ncbi:MAG: hypothetical protein ACXABG_06985 [Promethearchaeota archaeon]|jgi:hypothetical protein